MPTVSDLGRKIKAKHPEYADIPDEVLGLKVQARYPGSYDDFSPAGMASTPQPKGLQGPMAGPIQRAVQNLPGSAANALSYFGRASGGQSIAPGEHFSQANPIDELKSFAQPFVHPVDSFAADPIGTLLNWRLLQEGTPAATEGARVAGSGAMQGIKAEAPQIKQWSKYGAGAGLLAGHGGLETLLEGGGLGGAVGGGIRAVPAAVRGAIEALRRRSETQFQPNTEYYVPPVGPGATPPEPPPIAPVGSAGSAGAGAAAAPAYPFALDPEYVQQLQQQFTQPQPVPQTPRALPAWMTQQAAPQTIAPVPEGPIVRPAVRSRAVAQPAVPEPVPPTARPASSPRLPDWMYEEIGQTPPEASAYAPAPVAPVAPPSLPAQAAAGAPTNPIAGGKTIRLPKVKPIQPSVQPTIPAMSSGGPIGTPEMPLATGVVRPGTQPPGEPLIPMPAPTVPAPKPVGEALSYPVRYAGHNNPVAAWMLDRKIADYLRMQPGFKPSDMTLEDVNAARQKLGHRAIKEKDWSVRRGHLLEELK